MAPRYTVTVGKSLAWQLEAAAQDQQQSVSAYIAETLAEVHDAPARDNEHGGNRKMKAAATRYITRNGQRVVRLRGGQKGTGKIIAECGYTGGSHESLEQAIGYLWHEGRKAGYSIFYEEGMLMQDDNVLLDD